MTYGLYLVSSRTEEQAAGCTVNTFGQVASNPPQVSVSINKENHTAKVIQETKMYTAVSLTESASMDLIGKFGFFCSCDVDKFEPFAVETDALGLPYVAEQANARFTVKVTDSVDLGTHILFIGTVVESEVLSREEPMTYAYYHTVKGGKTPPKAVSYVADETPSTSVASATAAQAFQQGEEPQGRVAWRCTICGHIEEVDELPEDFTCPLCGVGKELFERLVL
ncbi:MAG: flavin reductase [Raoultibacter sp.]